MVGEDRKVSVDDISLKIRTKIRPSAKEENREDEY